MVVRAVAEEDRGGEEGNAGPSGVRSGQRIMTVVVDALGEVWGGHGGAEWLWLVT